MTNHARSQSVDDYIAMFPPVAREALETLRALVLDAAPGISERLSYGIVSFDYLGRNLVYFGGWQKHIGFYPVTDAVADAFGDELKPYKSGKGSLRFLLDRPMPLELVRRLVACRLEEVAALPRARRRS